DSARQDEDDDTHPTQEGRFREKLDHAHEAADQGHHDEAQKLYSQLMKDYRSLASQGKLDEDDKERLNELYDKVDRAKQE
ncbi:MAG: hypothetical protein SV186_03560, partial [Candidatus Nanohaloarchaea archaeon]|nr:hypothetical protein [Candidatus Nanohaloarchaea archaeon]